MKFTITANEAEQRFDRFLRKYFKQHKEIKLSDIFSWIRKGAIKVNGRKRPENRRLHIGDEITRDDRITTNKQADDFQKTKKVKLKEYPLGKIEEMIVHEDDHRLVFDKPADLVMHPGTGHIEDISLHDIMKIYLQKNISKKKERQRKELNAFSNDDSPFKPSFCFRLDRDTSGIVIAAKTYPALQYLNKLIRERKTDKTYLAVVSGTFPAKKVIDTPLFKGFDKKTGKAKVFVNHEQGQSAKTEAKLLQSTNHPQLGAISLIQVKIFTGRMHQIRVHLSSIGYPIIGDMMYGNPAINRIASKKAHIARQLLHSTKYGFFDIFSDTYLEFHSKKPTLFSSLIENGLPSG